MRALTTTARRLNTSGGVLAATGLLLLRSAAAVARADRHPVGRQPRRRARPRASRRKPWVWARQVPALSSWTPHGFPMYSYAGDSGPGQASGQGKNLSGGLWWVVAPSGSWIKTTGGSSSGSSPSSSSGGGY
jgi:Secreted repeat of unknown function